MAFQPPLNQIFIQSVASKVSAYRMGSGPLTAMSFTRLSRLCGGEGPGLLDFQDFFGCCWSGSAFALCCELGGGDRSRRRWDVIVT